MGSHSSPQRRIAFRRLAALLAIACLLALPAVASADPGTPGVSSAQDSVYPVPNGPTVLGEEPIAGSGGGGSEGGTAAANTTVTPSSGGGGGGVSSIPFTGLSAVLVLGAGLL